MNKMNEIESERVLDTLSKMMIDTKDSEDENHKAEKIYDDIYGKINGEYYAALTKMPSKENYKIIDNVKNLLKCMELLLKFPKLKYKNIIVTLKKPPVWEAFCLFFNSDNLTFFSKLLLVL